MADVLTPICRWAQNKSTLFLTVDLTDVKDPSVLITDRSVELKTYGNGAQGENFYQVQLDLAKDINVEKSWYIAKERYIQFHLSKKEDDQCFWDKIQQQPTKPGWLRIDFDRWQPEEDPEAVPDEDVEKFIDNITFENRIKSKIDEAKDDIRTFIRLAYLSIYNLTQGIAFTAVFTMLAVSLVHNGYDAFYRAYDEVSNLVVTCQLLAILEIINPLVGVVNTGVVAPIMQVGGRNFILFFVILQEKQLHTNPLICVLFLFWSSIEVIRYPFYVLSLFQKSFGWLTYLRYTTWIVLFPGGVITESLIIGTAMPLFAASHKLSVPMPNMLNFGFDFSVFLCFYLLIFIPGSLYQIRHLLILRNRKLNPRRRRDVKRD